MGFYSFPELRMLYNRPDQKHVYRFIHNMDFWLGNVRGRSMHYCSYLEQPLKKYFLSRTAKVDPKDGVSCPNFQ